MNKQAKFESAKANPSGTYTNPENVVKDNSLDDSEKLEILNIWKSEAIHMQESEAEGFEGGENSHLDAIDSAINSLSADSGSSVLKDLNN